LIVYGEIVDRSIGGIVESEHFHLFFVNLEKLVLPTEEDMTVCGGVFAMAAARKA